MAKHKTYTEKFKGDCIAFLIGAGYPENPYKLEETAKYLGVPSRTLRRWFQGENGAPAVEVVIQQKTDLAELYEQVSQRYLKHALEDEVVDELSGKDAVIAAATATDKMRLLRGLPTEIIEVVPQLVAALKEAGLDPVATFNQMLQKAHERTEQRTAIRQ